MQLSMTTIYTSICPAYPVRTKELGVCPIAQLNAPNRLLLRIRREMRIFKGERHPRVAGFTRKDFKNMNEFNRGFGAVDVRSMDTSVNVGLRTFMLGVYQKLALGIALSGGVAFLVGSGVVPGLTQLLLGTPLFYLFQFGPLALILGSAFLMRNPSPLATGILYW